MSIRFRNKDGKVNDQASVIDYKGGTRDDIILDKDGVKEILGKYFQRKYGYDKPPEVDITFLSDEHEKDVDVLVEIEFDEIEYPIPF